VTIDPVGGTGDLGVLPNVGAWANVNSDPSSYNDADKIAETGRFFWPEPDTSGAGITLNSPYHHGDFEDMMNQIKALQAIDRSYRAFPCRTVRENPC
jgi:hypothetical protein